MKKILLPLICSFYYFSLYSQQAPPQGINYQAMVYAPNGNQQVGVNSAGQLPANTEAVEVRFTLEEGNNGPVIYEEIHNDTTDQYGLLETIIGNGSTTSNSPGNFNQIDWSLGDPYLRVSITLVQSGTTVSSYQKLWSVPYALYAGQANTAAYADSSGYAQTAGNGITGVSDNGDGTLTFTYFDGSSYTTGPLTGVGNLGAAQSWSLTGNAGTDPQVNFIGTTDSTDWVVRTDSLERVRVKGNGFVGIGTDYPLYKFHVNGQLAYNVNSTGQTSRVAMDNNLNVRFREQLNYLGDSTEVDLDPTPLSNNGTSIIRFFRHVNTNAEKSIKFLRGNGSTNVSALIGVDGQNSFFQAHGGKFGIGTNSPQSELQVMGVSKFGSTGQNNVSIYMDSSSLLNPLISLNSYGMGLIEAPRQSNIGIRIQGNHWDDGFFVLTGPDNGLADKIPFKVLRNGWVGVGRSKPVNIFHVNNDVSGADSSFLVSLNGNVGIGTTSPTEKLQIDNGGIRINGFYGIGFQDQPFGNTTPNGNEGAKIYFDNTITADGNKDYLVLEKKDGSSVNPDGGIAFANRGNNGVRSTTMLIDGFGNVGIGTITPVRTLHVNSVMRLEPIPTAPASPGKGDMYFDSTLNKLRVYDGTTWQNCW